MITTYAILDHPMPKTACEKLVMVGDTSVHVLSHKLPWLGRLDWYQRETWRNGVYVPESDQRACLVSGRLGYHHVVTGRPHNTQTPTPRSRGIVRNL